MKNEQIIDFYGASHPELFEIERRCMDRPGKVIDYLNLNLPNGTVIDIGAGNGYTSEKLNKKDRLVLPMEPDDHMIDINKNLAWIKGTAQQIPFHDNSLDAAYATWAFFFSGMKGVDEGVREAERVIRPGGKFIIVDNYGDDEFTSLSPSPGPLSSSVDFWKERGFDYELIHTTFSFDSIAEARKLLSFYFEERGMEVSKREFEYKVVIYSKTIN
ncbi:hypothetical protein CEY16_01125 [Halalkalibacillus sediminis]|uniref:Methyltransferase type 11 domain-containing protein n=1 Tax=Halalkalibacillus sediminis TaxID=2018042 RepID=A0A2I0QVR3_9BACI|nr:class I SAM-dependent methyltransferase [Halalkalibacillus sediminis]PKR78389.1 hypothetical protein CEY16_01125 [Halalkalibacillus sediminis]